VPRLHRNIAIVGSVVLFHVAALWALQAGLLRRAVEIVIPVQILSELITPPAPKVEPPPTPPPKPVAIPESRPALNAPTGVLQAQPPPAPITAPVAAEARPTAPAPSPTEVELPSSDASYLQNPAPVYPPISKRLGEQGKVIVRVLIGTDGAPQKAELKRSSGFERLDQSALEYVMKCRYVPGKVGGVPQAMWHEAPVTFVLQ
jgi:periplasmic protein TonB